MWQPACRASLFADAVRAAQASGDVWSTSLVDLDGSKGKAEKKATGPSMKQMKSSLPNVTAMDLGGAFGAPTTAAAPAGAVRCCQRGHAHGSHALLCTAAGHRGSMTSGFPGQPAYGAAPMGAPMGFAPAGYPAAAAAPMGYGAPGYAPAGFGYPGAAPGYPGAAPGFAPGYGAGAPQYPPAFGTAPAPARPVGIDAFPPVPMAGMGGRAAPAPAAAPAADPFANLFQRK